MHTRLGKIGNIVGLGLKALNVSGPTSTSVRSKGRSKVGVRIGFAALTASGVTSRS